MIGNLWDYFATRAARITDRDNHPDNLPDQEMWQKLRPKIHQQYMKSLGLGNMPEKCDLRPTVTGSFEGEGYTADKVVFQLLPDVWGSAHIYRPANLPAGQTAPGVLYTCGHHAAGVEGYQHHAMGWAKRGYICLILDTIEQHDNTGDHHGLHSHRAPGWISMGYTGAGGEVFNGIRALDLLLEQPGIDPDRVGVTGLSGGGSQSFRLAAADDRLKAVATVAGISDPTFAIPNKLVQFHCDCMYEHNVFARDAAVWASLIAPRALMYCFARHDNLYTPEEFRSLHARTQARFEKLGIADRCQLVEYDGQHGYNHKSTVDAIHNWFDKHVAGEGRPEVDSLGLKEAGDIHDEQTLSVTHGVPVEPSYLNHLPELLAKPGQVRLPESPQQWQQTKTEVVDRLKKEVFHLIDDIAQPQTLTQVGDWTHSGLDRLAWQGTLDGMRQSVAQFDHADGSDQAVLVGIGDRAAEGFTTGIQMHVAAEDMNISTLGIEPRGGGRTAPHPDQQNILNREGCLVGMTPAMLMVQDLHHLWPHVKALPRVEGRQIYLHGKGEGALAMLYHALLNPDPVVAGVILEDLPRSHTHCEHQILGIRRVLDVSHAVGLLAPLPVALIANQGTQNDWFWATRAHARLSKPSSLINAPSLHVAMSKLLQAQPGLVT